MLKTIFAFGVSLLIWMYCTSLQANEAPLFNAFKSEELTLAPLEYSIQPSIPLDDLRNAHFPFKNIKKWQFIPTQNAVIPEVNQSIWYRARLENDQNQDIYRVLDFAEMLFYQLDVYLIHNNELIYQSKTGLEYSYDERSLKSRLFAFEFNLPANSITDLYIRIQTPHQPLIYPVLYSNSEYVASAVQHSAISLLIIGLLIGLLLLMSFATLLSHHGIKVISFGSVIVTMTINILYANGIIFQSMPNSPQLHMYLYPITICISSICTMWFARELFEMPKRMPIVDKIVMIFIAIYIAIPTLSLIYSPAALMLTLNYVAMASVIFLFFIGFAGLAMRQSSAYLFLIGMTLFAGLTALTVLGSLGLIPYGPSGRHLYELGILAMGLFFTLAIGQQLYLERLERINIQQEVNIANTRNQIKSDFIATMSHEIRTPINGVLGMAKLLKNTSQDETQQRYTQAINESGNRLLNLINDILDLSRVEAGKLTLEPSPFSIKDLVNHCRIIAESHQYESGIEFNTQIDENIPNIIIADETRISQVLNNLLGNAFKFTHEGSVTLHVTRCLEESNHICFAINDTGIGIEKDMQEQLFQPYTQADKSMSRRYGGSGLGLAICQRIMTLMGGNIYVESTTGKGSEFIMRFPIEEPADTSQFKVRQKNDSAEHQVASEYFDISVLVAEDNPVNKMVIEGMLGHKIKQLTLVNNGQEAVNTIKKSNFDLLLIDCEMPIMDGFTATEIIRKIPKCKQLPIYALTAHAMESNKKRCLDSGMNGMLTKPINDKELHQLLRDTSLEKTDVLSENS